MIREGRRYRAYLLRMWQERQGEGYIWRASLETPGTGKRKGFATIGELFEFLERETEEKDHTGNRG